MTKAWQKENIDDIFQKVIVEDLLKKFEDIHRALHSIKEHLGGFKTPFDVENKIATAASSGVKIGCFIGEFLIRLMLHYPKVTISIVTAGIISGIVFSGLKSFDVVDDFEKVRLNAFQARINDLSKEMLKCYLRQQYSDVIQKVIGTFLEGELEKEMNKMKENISTMKYGHESFKFQEKTLSSLRYTVNQNIDRLQQIGCIDIATE